MPEQISVDSRIYTIAKDFQSSYQMLVSGLVRDELTGEAPTGAITISLQPTNVAATDVVMQTLVSIKVVSGGLFCLAGQPERVFPHLSTTDYTLGLQVQVPGYKVETLTVSIDKNSTFPLPTLPPVDLQRLPIRIQGRVVGMTTPPSPLAGARVDFVDEPNPPIPLTEHMVVLSTPLYFNHATGTTVRQRQLTSSGTAKQLAASTSRGSQMLMLADRTGLAANDVLLVGSNTAGEYVVIDNLPADVPGQVNLYNTLNSSFAAGTAVQKYVRGTIGTSTTVARSVEAGQDVLFLPVKMSSASAELLEIADATAALVEYHALGASTDANGYYRLDGFTRVQTVYMEASAAGFAALDRSWTIDYGQSVNNVDFRLLPGK